VERHVLANPSRLIDASEGFWSQSPSTHCPLVPSGTFPSASLRTGRDSFPSSGSPVLVFAVPPVRRG
jgi:hypothetical protein